MRGILCRGLRLELVRGLGLALAMPALALVAGHAQDVSTTTTLTATSTQAVQVNPAATCTLTNLQVTVTANAGVAAGTVAIMDGSGSSAVQLASVALDATGQATAVLDLAEGAHALSAVYAGNTTFESSTSASSSLTISSQCAAAFVVTVSNLTSANNPANTLTPGQAGTAVVTVVPSQDFVSSLAKAPGYVALSCSGLPDQAGCILTPADVEILPGQGAAVSSSMAIQTYAAATSSISPAARPGKNAAPIAWAFLLPGSLGLIGLAWGTRRRQWLSRLSLVALVGLIALLGTTACNPRYGYEHHGPAANPATPAGTYTVTVTGQYNNGVTANISNTTFALTVK